ncbi:MAG: hypothetical protein ABI315_14680 [Bacteroidia bacterium]
MKNKMLKALGACFTLMTLVIHAQLDPSTRRKFFNNGTDQTLILNDTIIFTPDAQTKIFFIGDNLKRMVAFGKIDSLKTLLINDLEEAKKNPSFPVDSKMTHYFVHPNGKRRLKTESADYIEQEVNVAKEKQSLNLDLSPYGYIIHDLSNDYEIQIFVKEPAQISALKDVNFNESIAVVAENRKLQKKNFRLDIEKTQQGWTVRNKFSVKNNSSIVLVPAIGVSLIGSRWSPIFGADVLYMYSNKHARPIFKTGFGWLPYTFTDLKDDKLSDLSLISCLELKFLWNASLKTSAKSKWAGFQVGWLQDKTYAWTGNTAFQHPGPLNNAFKVGFLLEGIGPFNFSIDQVYLNLTLIYGVTFKIAF